MNSVICIASGPSLTRSDCDLAVNSVHPVIAVNSSWQLIPACHYLFAADCSWWDRHHAALATDAQRWTVSGRAHLRYDINLFRPSDSDSFNPASVPFNLLSIWALSESSCWATTARWNTARTGMGITLTGLKILTPKAPGAGRVSFSVWRTAFSRSASSTARATRC